MILFLFMIVNEGFLHVYHKIKKDVIRQVPKLNYCSSPYLKIKRMTALSQKLGLILLLILTSYDYPESIKKY